MYLYRMIIVGIDPGTTIMGRFPVPARTESPLEPRRLFLLLLALEKQRLYGELRSEGLTEESSVALISGAVVSVHPDEPQPGLRATRDQDARIAAALEGELEDQAEQARKRLAERTRLEDGAQEGPAEGETEGEDPQS